MLRLLHTPNKRLKNLRDIPNEVKQELLKSEREVCDVCESFLDPEHKYIVWDDNDDIFGWACAYCQSIYDMSDEMHQIGTGPTTNEIIGEA